MLTFFIILYVVTELQYINAFFNQRGALEISRQINIDLRPFLSDSVANVITNIGRVIGWLSLFGIFYYGSWLYVVVLVGVTFLITTFYPVSDSRYFKVFSKLEQMDENLYNTILNDLYNSEKFRDLVIKWNRISFKDKQ